MIRILEAKERSVGGLRVLRALPRREQRSVGPFVFLDELGPVVLPAGRGLDVPPHPHIGLATLTWRLTGELVHRDSLGCTQTILPGAVNWMTAGRGIAHSERSAASERDVDCSVHGIQLWAALPPELEECEPSFEHHPAEALPQVDLGEVEVTLIAGRAFGAEAPVRVHSPLFCAEARWSGDGALALPAELGERAVYPLVGEARVRDPRGLHRDERIARGQLAVLEDGAPVELSAAKGTQLLLLGGEARSAPLYMHWNYVASDPALIERAKRRWAGGSFGPVVGDPGTPAVDPLG